MAVRIKQGRRYQMQRGGWFDQAEGPDRDGDYQGSDFLCRDPKGVAYLGEGYDAVADLGPIPAPAQPTPQTEAGEDPDNRDTVAIMECVVWLTLNCHEFAPEYLAGELARAMLKEHTQ